MNRKSIARKPREVAGAVITVLSQKLDGASVTEIVVGVEVLIGKTARSSVRSYLNLHPELFERVARGRYTLRLPR